MTNLATRARQNRQTALEGLARRRSGLENGPVSGPVSGPVIGPMSGQLIRPVFGQATDHEADPMPVLSFLARRRACPELAAMTQTQATPSAPRLPTLVLVAGGAGAEAA